MKKMILAAALLMGCQAIHAHQYWDVDTEGNSITWQVKKGQVHSDHIEMGGKRVAAVLRYGVTADGTFTLNKSMVWPLLRTIPNNTHASLMRRFDWNVLDGVTVNGRNISEKVCSISFDGTLNVMSDVNVRNGKLTLRRSFFTSTDHPSLIEVYRFVNEGKQPISIETACLNGKTQTPAEKGVYGTYTIYLSSNGKSTVKLAPGETYTLQASISAYKEGEMVAILDAATELKKREELVSHLMNNLVLDTPDEVIDRMFAFSKIRACESIYQTKGGPMHGPGGETFYAAIWANDQAEYINPYFPFIGYDYGNASAMNSFSHFARFMNNQWKPIPSSIIAEGDDIWAGAGDRGDAAMIAYGASRYALASGNQTEAKKLWPLIEWCLEYCHRKINNGGVVASDSDELEGRFPAGKANLCTSSLYYDALLSAAYLAENLNKGNALAKTYRKQATTLAENIDNYFAGPVEGFDTYAYYKGNDVLRSWICIPLTVGIYDRAEATIDALFSPRLWTSNGLLTQAGSKTFWDRSTLYALRGVYSAGYSDKAHKFMKSYSQTRLLGSHVPYAIEAWPEGGKRHLSAESALYGRVITEGMFGIRPTGLHSFTVTPQMPAEWNEMALRHIRAFGGDFDIEVRRIKGNTINVMVKQGGKTIADKKVKTGTAVRCKIQVL